MKGRNNKNGYALISIMIIGLGAVLLMLAIASAINAVAQNEGLKKNQTELMNGAEFGVDYAVNQFNTATSAGLTPSIDVPSNQISKQSVLPPDVLSMLNNSNMSVAVTVKRVPTDLDWQKIASWSSIYSPQTDQSKSVSAGFKSPPVTNVKVDSWRILEVTSSYPTGLSKTVRVILQPRYDLPPNGKMPPNTSTGYFFNYGMFGNQGINLSPSNSLTIAGVNPSNANADDIFWDNKATDAANYELTLASNESFQPNANTVLKGNVQVSSVGSGSNPVASNFGTAPTISGTVQVNGVDDGSVSATNGPNGTAGDNVLSDADKVNTFVNPSLPANTPPTRLDVNQTPFAKSLTPQISQTTMAPGLTASSSTPSLPDLTTLPVSSGLGMLPAGDYQTSSFSTAGITGTLPPVSITGPTNIFVQGQTGANTSLAVNIDSKAIQNTGVPQNLQIWYNGNLPVNINVTNGKTFKGLVYAPNAKVTVSGDGNFEGALLAGTVNVTMTGNMNLRTDLAPSSSSPSTGAGPTYQYKPGVGSVVTGYRAVSWQEI